MIFVFIWFTSLFFLFPFTNLFFLPYGWRDRERRLVLFHLPVDTWVMTWLSRKSLQGMHLPDPVKLFINLSVHNKAPKLGSWWAPGSSPGVSLVFANPYFFIIWLTRHYAYELEASGHGHPNRKETLKFNQSSKLVGKVPSLHEPGAWKPKLSIGAHRQPQACRGADRLWSLLCSFYQNCVPRSYCTTDVRETLAFIVFRLEFDNPPSRWVKYIHGLKGCAILKDMKKMRMICRIITDVPSGVRTSGFIPQVCCWEAETGFESFWP